jgi:hypothetical protein
VNDIDLCDIKRGLHEPVRKIWQDGAAKFETYLEAPDGTWYRITVEKVNL